MSETYRATCTCGYRGRWFKNPNDATQAEDTHLLNVQASRGRLYDRSGKNHCTDLEEKE